MTRSRDLANLADGTEFSASDHSKLDGIEASATADQTNAEIRAAVEAATDSNVFTDADHSKLDGVAAGATDNTVASAALPKAGGALTGAITTNSTFDGVDIATRDAVLTATTTTANAALPKSGGTMTGNLAINSGSPELYFGTTGNHYNWRIAAQETVDAGFEIAVGSQDTNYANDTYAAKFVVTSDGNVLVGTTATDTAAVGFRYRSSLNAISSVADGGVAAYFGRRNSDGEILRFRKDDATVGSIGTLSSTGPYIGNGDTALMFRASANSILPWNTTTNYYRDNAIDLGDTGDRFKDLYLSGGVYLGGTGAANKLTDYETGEWNPTDLNGNALTKNVNSQSCMYTKVGRMVTVVFDISGTASTSGSQIRGLPFAAKTGLNAGTMTNGYATTGFSPGVCGHIFSSNIYMMLGQAAENWANGRRLIGSAVYFTS